MGFEGRRSRLSRIIPDKELRHWFEATVHANMDGEPLPEIPETVDRPIALRMLRKVLPRRSLAASDHTRSPFRTPPSKKRTQSRQTASAGRSKRILETSPHKILAQLQRMKESEQEFRRQKHLLKRSVEEHQENRAKKNVLSDNTSVASIASTDSDYTTASSTTLSSLKESNTPKEHPKEQGQKRKRASEVSIDPDSAYWEAVKAGLKKQEPLVLSHPITYIPESMQLMSTRRIPKEIRPQSPDLWSSGGSVIGWDPDDYNKSEDENTEDTVNLSQSTKKAKTEESDGTKSPSLLLRRTLFDFWERQKAIKLGQSSPISKDQSNHLLVTEPDAPTQVLPIDFLKQQERDQSDDCGGGLTPRLAHWS